MVVEIRIEAQSCESERQIHRYRPNLDCRDECAIQEVLVWTSPFISRATRQDNIGDRPACLEYRQRPIRRVDVHINYDIYREHPTTDQQVFIVPL